MFVDPAALASTVPFGALNFAFNDTIKAAVLPEGASKVRLLQAATKAR